MKPRIGITIGDPAGVGPELVLKSLSNKKISRLASYVVYGDEKLLTWVNKKVLRKSRLPKAEYKSISRLAVPVQYGKPKASYGYVSGRYIEEAVADALSGRIHAMVTAPINKEAFKMGGWGEKFVGHTEMLTQLTSTKSSALMLIIGRLRAIHVTSHVPLNSVAQHLTKKRILETIELAHTSLKKMGISKPRIAVCGLNPHAGDNGLIGSEERDLISPAVKSAKHKKINVFGPFSADTVWPNVRDGIYDVGVAMYHDQGQIPVKLLAFSNTKDAPLVRGVNVTAGLPIIRTSVAHGTAYEIAGRGIASAESLVQAIELAVDMASQR